jgi:hypothetical protein
MRFASASASRALAALIGALLLCAPAHADECGATPEELAKIKAEEEVCAKKAAHEVCVHVRDTRDCPITAVVATTPNIDKPQWQRRTFAYGVGLIKCPNAQTWVFVEPARGHTWQDARPCELEGMLFKFRPAGATNESFPKPDEARALRGRKKKG